MTLESAIQHLKESLSDHTHKWSCEECKAEHEQLLEWLEDYKQLKAGYIELDNQIRKVNTENDELKRMLRLAVEDIGKLKNCEKYPFCGGCPKESEPLCKWKHHDEAMELLGGTENAKN